MINTIFIRISSIFIVMLLAATVLVAETYLLSYLIKLPPGPALPYYTNPSKYERLNGPPDQVCKFWGDGSKYWNKGHERTECISNLKRSEQ